MRNRNDIFATIHVEGALLTVDLLQRLSNDDRSIDGLTPEAYHHPGERLNETINRSWNALQGAWANFKTAQQTLVSSDIGTSITRERWLLPLFRELEYGRLPAVSAQVIEGKSYPISHFWEAQVPIHLVSYQIKLDERTRGISGAANASPHSLVQVFLNRSEAHVWGLVSNGYKLRLLRDNAAMTRQSYIEFDLQAMMEGEFYSDFVLLWLLCHQSRFETGRECWLEKWAKLAETQGTRALNDLRNGVEQAITALGEGFLEHRRNAALRERLRDGEHGGGLHKQDYYRQLLRLVYRLLFLFVAEDRGLLYDPASTEKARNYYTEYYSTKRLRRIAERLKGTRHSDLYEALRQVMRLLGGANNGLARELGLPILGSFLFDDKGVADVIDCQIANSHLLDAVRALAFIEDRSARLLFPVDFKNLDSDELGGIYESLLELHPEINIEGRRFALRTAGGNERKTSGSYYTPTSLITALLDSALNPVIERAKRAADPQDALLDLKICDPACGSGHFLIAAAHRAGKALAQVRTSEEEPAPEAYRNAVRDVIACCIYGVDINPDAVELCKVGLWLESLEPGKPLTFLDHRILVGNSLIGTTPRLIAGGIPEGAFQPIEGDDKKFTSSLRKQNKQEAGGQLTLDEAAMQISARNTRLTQAINAIDEIEDRSMAGIRAKELSWTELQRSADYANSRLIADAWCAAFVLRKTPDSPPPVTNAVLRWLTFAPDMLPATVSGGLRGLPAIKEEIRRLARQYHFFHWHIAFPDVFSVPEDAEDAENPQTGWNGGFDCVLGNPPWEHTEIKEQEWFAQRDRRIAEAEGALRKSMIAGLKNSIPTLYTEFQKDLRTAEGFSHFVRASERFPLTARGRTNTYPLFAEFNRQIINNIGRVGCIVPSGIATDDTTKFFFQDLMDTASLVSLYDFENREDIFEGIGHGRFKFCLLTLTGTRDLASKGAEFIFFATNVNHLTDIDRRFTLSADDVALLNPNTRTCATFRSRRDAEITKAIYRRIPVLVREDDEENGNPWGITFKQGLFNMTSDSHLFRTREQLEQRGYRLEGNWFVSDNVVYLPLYEAKMIHHFDHRYGDFRDYPEGALTTTLPEVPVGRLMNPNYAVLPRYWVEESEVAEVIGSTPWMIGFRDIARSTDERTVIASALPRSAVSNKLPILILNRRYGQFYPYRPSDDEGFVLKQDGCLLGNLASYIFDYITRQKIGGTSLNFYIVKQLLVLPPSAYDPNLVQFIDCRVLELTYTAYDLISFARDVGYDGAPFKWDEDRRFLMRCELDALFFQLYDVNRDDAGYIMDTFPIVRRKDEAIYGYFRTKEMILHIFDLMADNSYTSPLDPPAGDPRAAHRA